MERPKIVATTVSAFLLFLIVQLSSNSCAKEDIGSVGSRATAGPNTPPPVAKTAPAAQPAAASSGQTAGQTAGQAARDARLGLPAVADIVAATLPSVINVRSTRVTRTDEGRDSPLFRDPLFRRFFGEGPQRPHERQEMSLGSAVIVSPDGVCLTNNHVVEHAEDISVSLSDGRQFSADVVGTDPLSDLAVIRIRDKPKDLKPIELGDSTTARLGDFVLAIGNPFGVGQTVTMGIVSAKGRADLGIVDYEDFIQTDAAINPGNSGGALVSLEGKLLGINTAILSRTGGYQGIGFAIPTEMAKPIMEQLLQKGKVVRGWLGIAIQELTPELARALGLESARGVLVSDVSKEGPAEKAGLEPRDVIVAVGGEPTLTAGKLRNVVASRAAGSEVKIDILRGGAKKTLTAMLGELPARATSVAAGEGGREMERPRREEERAPAGITLAPLSADARREYNIDRNVKGVLVADVGPGSLAARAGLLPGDVISEVNRRAIDTPQQLVDTFRRAKEPLLLRVQREGSIFYTVLGISEHEHPPAG